MNRVLITGATGFIGGRLVQALSHDKSVQIYTPRVTLTASSHLEKECYNIDTIVHLAGISGQESFKSPIKTYTINSIGTAKLIEAATKLGVKRFINMSTAQIYGDNLRLNVNEKTGILNPNIYGASKIAAEQVVGKNGISIRLANGFGTPVNSNLSCWSLMANKIVLDAVETGEINITSLIDFDRNFVSMSHIVQVLQQLIHADPNTIKGKIVNLSGYYNFSISQFAEVVSSKFANKIKIRYPLGFVKRQSNLFYHSVIDLGINTENKDFFHMELENLINNIK